MTRRALLKTSITTAALTAVGGRLLRAQSDPIRQVKAVVFDTFGTVVDWRSSIMEEGAAWAKAKNLNVDWARFADRWRDGYAIKSAKAKCRGPSLTTCTA
jgi:hypothetical protein